MPKVVENITLDFRPNSKEDDAYKVKKKCYRCKEDKDLNCFMCFYIANKENRYSTAQMKCRQTCMECLRKE